MRLLGKSTYTNTRRGRRAAREIQSAMQRLTSSAHEVTQKAAVAAESVGDWAGGRQAELSRSRLFGQSARFVAAHPVKAIGLALVAGILISRIAL